MIRANARLLRDGVTTKIKGDSSRRRARLGGGAGGELRNKPSRGDKRIDHANGIHGRQDDRRKLERGMGRLADEAVARIMCGMLVGATRLVNERNNQSASDEEKRK